MGDLERDTRLSGGEGKYTITLSPDWDIWGPNGGYMAAVALRAAGMEAKIKRPISIACHFLGVPKPEPVDVEVRAVQAGRRAESIHVVYSQDGRAMVQAIVRTAAEAPGVEHKFMQAPDVPPPDQLKSFLDLWDGPLDPIPFWQNFDSRIVYPEGVRLDAMDAPSPAKLHEWYRFVPTPTFDDPFVDAARAVVLMDTFAWPTAANPHRSPEREYQGINLDVVAWFYEPAPKSQWLLCDYDSPIATKGVVAGQGRVWSEDGRLVAIGGAQVLCISGRERGPLAEKKTLPEQS
jgi:acyl-CoA thioesterase-2